MKIRVVDREDVIVYEKGMFWVFLDKKKARYDVYRSGLTHSTGDSAYDFTPDGLSLAIARVDYLHKRHNLSIPSNQQTNEAVIFTPLIP